MGPRQAVGRPLAAVSTCASSMAGEALRRYSLKVGARCVIRARRDLCGGCSAMGIPTASIGQEQTPTKGSFPEAPSQRTARYRRPSALVRWCPTRSATRFLLASADLAHLGKRSKLDWHAKCHSCRSERKVRLPDIRRIWKVLPSRAIGVSCIQTILHASEQDGHIAISARWSFARSRLHAARSLCVSEIARGAPRPSYRLSEHCLR